MFPQLKTWMKAHSSDYLIDYKYKMSNNRLELSIATQCQKRTSDGFDVDVNHSVMGGVGLIAPGFRTTVPGGFR